MLDEIKISPMIARYIKSLCRGIPSKRRFQSECEV